MCQPCLIIIFYFDYRIDKPFTCEAFFILVIHKSVRSESQMTWFIRLLFSSLHWWLLTYLSVHCNRLKPPLFPSARGLVIPATLMTTRKKHLAWPTLINVLKNLLISEEYLKFKSKLYILSDLSYQDCTVKPNISNLSWRDLPPADGVIICKRWTHLGFVGDTICPSALNTFKLDQESSKSVLFILKRFDYSRF